MSPTSPQNSGSPRHSASPRNAATRRDAHISAASCGLCGVVLVGGRSSRMGRDKAALPHPAGGTFLEHAIHRLLALGCPVIVSGTPALPAAIIEQPSVTALPDPLVAGKEYAGPVTGLVAALRYAAAVGAIGILVTPVDMPCLNSEDLESMRAAFAEWIAKDSAKGEAAYSQPLIGTFDGLHREPLVAIYTIAMLAPFQQLAAGSDRSLNRWLGTQPHRLHRLPTVAAPNVNTPAEYDQVLGSAKTPAPNRES